MGSSVMGSNIRMALDRGPYNTFLEIKRKLITNFCKQEKDEINRRDTSTYFYEETSEKRLRSSSSKIKRVISQDVTIIEKRKRAINLLDDKKEDNIFENLSKLDGELRNKKMKLLKPKTKQDVKYQKHKITKPIILRRKVEKSSLDLKYFWRRSDPVRTFTKKDEYMFLDFTDKGKNHSHSRLRRWNRSSL